MVWVHVLCPPHFCEFGSVLFQFSRPLFVFTFTTCVVNLGSNNPVLYRVYKFILNMHLTKTFD